MNSKVVSVVFRWALVSSFAGVSCQGQPGTPDNKMGARAAGVAATQPARVNSIRGWLSWRGPLQTGQSLERGLPSTVAADGPGSWTFNRPGRGTPAIADGRVYSLCYRGTGGDLQEEIVCLDERNGNVLWEHRFTDFLSDVIYYRFSIGAPTIDPETGNVHVLSSAGLLTCLTRDGKVVWQHSMMSEYGRLTFPNGRTGAVLIDSGLAIVHVISSSWGAHAPARDRFYAFDKKTGEPIWSSTPGGRPRDSSFSFPTVAWENGRRVLYAGLGGGYVVCVNVLTGDPIWRFQLAVGGLNSNPLVYKNSIIELHGKENVDTSTIGRMVAIKRGAEPEPGKGPVELGHDAELWRNDKIVMFTSSPVLVGNRIYQTVHTGELYCVDADTGRTVWQKKLASDQIHASPTWGDGKLYVPMNNGSFYILEPSDAGCEVLQHLDLDGNCLGAPAIAGGRIYVHTTERLYCFAGGTSPALPQPAAEDAPPRGALARIQIVPGDICIRQGQGVQFRVRGLDAAGRVVTESMSGAKWTGVPPLGKDAQPVATVIKAEVGGMKATARLRIVPACDYSDDFEDAVLKPSPRADGRSVAPPRSWWVGARAKWEIAEKDGNKVLQKTLKVPLFQRTMSLTGHPDTKNYTAQIDIMSDGNRRIMSSGGLVNQRYLITLKGNYQTLEVSSNMELLKEHVPFRWKPHVWYRLKTRVDLQPDGSAIVRAKAWPREGKEPDAWTIEVNHRHGHTHGSPGIWGFVPQSRFRIYLDNYSVTSND